MKARPILFQTEMVRALLDGRKVQTRRQLKPQPVSDDLDNLGDGETLLCAAGDQEWRCPYGQPGDLLWLREGWKPDAREDYCTAHYKADGAHIVIENTIEAADAWMHCRRVEEQYPEMAEPKWRPSIHMPRWANRITLCITDVRVERVRDISNDDAKSEGLRVFNEDDANLYYTASATEESWPDGWYHTPRAAFGTLWNSINNNWHENPWVWVLTFEVIQANVDQVLQQEEVA